MFRKRSLLNHCIKATLAIMAAICLALPVGALAQGNRQMQLNLVENRTWPDVTVNMTITGPDGKAVPDLDAGQFQVIENGAPQSVVGLALGPERSVPLAVVLALDISGSMNGENKLPQAKAAAIAFLDSLRPEDNISLVAFNEKAQVVVSSTNNRAALINGINSLQAGGNTAIYDALYKSTQLLNPEPAAKRKAVILLTDGADTSSQYSPVVAAQIAKTAGVLVYTIGLGPDANDGVLTDLVKPSGGRYYKAPTGNDLAGIYQAISVELNSQVFLKYKSTTRLERRYQLVTLTVKYTAPDGQVIEKSITYRPPDAAIAEATPAAALPLPPAVGNVGLPPGLTDAAVAGSPQINLEAGAPMHLMSMVAGVLAGVGVLLAMLGVSYLLAPSPTSARVQSYVGGPALAEDAQAVPGFFTRVILPALESTGRRLARLSPKGYSDHIEHLLTLTGPPYRLKLGSFLGTQVALAVVSVVLLLLWAVRTSPDTPSQWVLAVVLGVFIGLYLPYFWLKRRVTRRQQAVLKALPGALDFLAINVEAGLGFDAALTQVVQKWRNTLTDEFALLLIDFQIGKPRKDAWRDLIQRTQVTELTTFVTAMLQNEQIGASIGTLLRTQADQMRVRRRQRAEEEARKAPVKMLIPMVFFILPGIFVVILGPAVPQFLNTFAQMGH